MKERDVDKKAGKRRQEASGLNRSLDERDDSDVSLKRRGSGR